MRGMQSTMLIGAIMGGRGKKNKAYQQPGGCLLYLGIPVVGFIIAASAYFNNSDVQNPVIPIWITPLIIFAVSIGLVVLIGWVRKVDRKEHKDEKELKNKQFMDAVKNHTLAKKYQ